MMLKIGLAIVESIPPIQKYDFLSFFKPDLKQKNPYTMPAKQITSLNAGDKN